MNNNFNKNRSKLNKILCYFIYEAKNRCYYLYFDIDLKKQTGLSLNPCERKAWLYCCDYQQRSCCKNSRWEVLLRQCATIGPSLLKHNLLWATIVHRRNAYFQDLTSGGSDNWINIQVPGSEIFRVFPC